MDAKGFRVLGFRVLGLKGLDLTSWHLCEAGVLNPKLEIWGAYPRSPIPLN